MNRAAQRIVTMCQRARAGALLALIVLGAMLLAGCASQPYDPAPPRDRPLLELRVESPLALEDSYRLLHARLSECLRSSSYHVQPRFEHDPARAWIMVVQGLGLDRLSSLGNRFAARFDLRGAASGSEIVALINDRELEPIARAVHDWVAQDARAWVAQDARAWLTQDARAWVAQDARAWLAQDARACR